MSDRTPPSWSKFAVSRENWESSNIYLYKLNNLISIWLMFILLTFSSRYIPIQVIFWHAKKSLLFLPFSLSVFLWLTTNLNTNPPIELNQERDLVESIQSVGLNTEFISKLEKKLNEVNRIFRSGNDKTLKSCCESFQIVIWLGAPSLGKNSKQDVFRPETWKSINFIFPNFADILMWSVYMKNIVCIFLVISLS